jgi:hypothetical protein
VSNVCVRAGENQCLVAGVRPPDKEGRFAVRASDLEDLCVSFRFIDVRAMDDELVSY